MEEIRKQMKVNVRSMNKLITDKYIDDLTDDQLLNHVHPLDRKDFEYRINNLKE